MCTPPGLKGSGIVKRRRLEFFLKGIFVSLFTGLHKNFLLLLTFDMFGEGQKRGQHEAISEWGWEGVVHMLCAVVTLQWGASARYLCALYDITNCFSFIFNQSETKQGGECAQVWLISFAFRQSYHTQEEQRLSLFPPHVKSGARKGQRKRK